jgi:hypothetical protein
VQADRDRLQSEFIADELTSTEYNAALRRLPRLPGPTLGTRVARVFAGFGTGVVAVLWIIVVTAFSLAVPVLLVLFLVHAPPFTRSTSNATISSQHDRELLACSAFNAAVADIGQNKAPPVQLLNSIVSFGEQSQNGALSGAAAQLSASLNHGGVNAYAKAMGKVGEACQGLGMLLES